MNDKKRKIALIVLAIVMTIIGVRVVKSFAPEKEGGGKTKEVYKAVRVAKVKPGRLSTSIQCSGKLSAYEKIDVYSEVNGVVFSESFREGNSFKKGQPIIRLNADEFSNQLKASKSQLISQVASMMGDLKIDFPEEYASWVDFLDSLNVNKMLPALPESDAATLKRFVAGKGVINSYYSIKSQEEKMSKFTILAPFDGTVTQTMTTSGALVRAGQKLGSYINPSLFELETEVSLSDLEFVKEGTRMKLYSDELHHQWNGTVSRINEVIDPTTQMVKVYVGVRGKQLKDGMYLRGEAEGIFFDNVVKVNRKLIANNGLFVVEGDQLKFKKIEVLHTDQSEAMVRGLESADLIVADNMKGLYEGMKVSLIK